MAKIKFELDKPVTAALAYAKGLFGESKFPDGDFYTFTLTSGDVMFIDLKRCEDPNKLFESKNIGARDPFVICLRKTRAGGRYFEVHKLSEAQEEPAALDPARYPDNAGAFIPPSKLESDLVASLAEQQRKALASKLTPSVPAVESITKQLPNPIALVPAAPVSLMSKAMVAAIDSAIVAQQYATSKGLLLCFAAEDIRAIAATLYIQHSKDAAQNGQRQGGR